MLITGVQRFTVRDGPGIRTTVFTKGCSLRCAWCHNPETISPGIQVQFSQNRCIRCGRCGKICGRFGPSGGIREDASVCSGCGKCVEACPVKALALSGRELSAAGAAALVERDRVFFQNSGGGVTISGGEPLLQKDLPQVLAALQERGIHTAVDTALHVPWASVEAVIPHTSLFLADIKAIGERVHKRWTGFGNRMILENFRRLLETDAEIWVRVPFIPGANDGEMGAIAAYLKETAGDRVSVEIIPFHNYAAGKYRSLGMRYAFADVSPPEDAAYRSCLRLFKGLNRIAYDGKGGCYGCKI